MHGKQGASHSSGVADSVYSFYSEYPYPLVYPFSKRHEQLMRKFIRMWGLRCESELKGLSILDAGCGTGEKSVYLASLGASVTALDINKTQLSYAQALARRHRVGEKIKFVCADILALDLNDKFDLVLCSGVLHHTPDVRLGFSRLARHLRQDGRILIGLYNKYSRIHYRLLRWALHKAYGNDPKRIMEFVNGFPLSFLLRGKASQQTLYDRYAIPYESYHSLREIREMFRDNNISIMHVSPPILFDNDMISQLSWLIKGKSFFMVSGKRHQ
ncbi:MAG: class I SAM-dependent methyltransferase [Candidatus Micrarchaeota archaeon]|nr:class I SAM-dependent methyltransferase [Candidatus Micrarchaeota archaeon]